MERINTPTAAADMHGPGKPGFRDGVGAATLAPTRLNAAWFDNVQEEICNVIEGAGHTLDGNDNTQLYSAINVLTVARALRASQFTSALNALLAEAAVGGGYSESNDIWCAVRSKSSTNTFHAVVAGEAGTIWTVSSSETWTERTAGGSYSGDFRAAATNTVDGVGSGVVLLAGTGGMIQTAAYNAPATWTVRTPDASFSGTFYGAAHAGSTFVLVGTGGTIQASPDGTTWTARTPAASYSGTWRSVTVWGGLFIAVGTSGVVQTSPDGITWTARTSGVGTDLYSITHDGSYAYALASDGTIIYSADGITWTTAAVAQPLGAAANAVFADRDRLYVLGDSGQVAVCVDIALGIWHADSLISGSGQNLHCAVPFGHRNQSLGVTPVRLAIFGELGGNHATPAFS